MCDTVTPVAVLIGPDTRSLSAIAPGVVPVDSCIASQVRELNALGVRTAGSCCGHGMRSSAYVEVVPSDARKMDDLGYQRRSGPGLPNYAGLAHYVPR